jgi:hypothetical protein
VVDMMQFYNGTCWHEFGLIIFSKSVYVGHDDAAIGIYKEAKAKQIRLVVSVH